MTSPVALPVLERAAARPDHVALRPRQGADVTYGELTEMANRWSARLPSGVRVALWPRSEPESIATVLGIWLAGSSLVLLNRHVTPSQADRVLAWSRPEIVVTERGQLASGVGDPAPIDHGEMLVGLTSGSSGDPKLFVRDHASWATTFRRSDWLVDLAEDDVVATPGAMDHTHFLYGALHSLARGATVDLRGATSTDWDRATVMYSVPTIASDLVGRVQQLGSVRAVLSTGAAWPVAARERFRRQLPPGGRIYDFYGASELSFVSVSDAVTAPAGSVGRPFPGVEIRIIRDDGASAEVGEAGAVFVRSDMLFRGYLTPEGSLDESSAEWVSVGDRGYVDTDGSLYLVGRRSRMFTRGALNVEPEAIEQALSQHPGVTAAACVARPSRRWGAVPVVFATVRDSTSEAELRTWCSEHLDIVHRPQSIHIVDDMPITHRGKIDYGALQQLVAGT